MPPDRDIGFYIDLEWGTHLISILPYHMALLTLKTKLQELLNKGFIHPNASLWVLSVVF